ncbi:MAG: glucose-6-phosphate dehydrogenase [Candidatus Ryanbacteria bacterium RIFCSPHIGHO2_02_FULL_45_17b]|uniref:Glucose-6-phosphate 1-dehydrogenase n=1 Tax=Candidatus Ryanbacteria bacterium RIFCSPHIGHO2_01_FULL_45_22 TaxID=1802114 RepID=A0A1G2G2L9_9BACT|nr:MAG: glucose-6-phosphate dehydrogenase [Candidatus Ryanbacteria bacterium RIFCSPHIGHO2_01_FULL_45_22]OGZ47660.1 MAG: glucose-6-phosphate dehydrogenase [Candidatus Ryanbacteria bacterium RIFCSPHIGHO2_02_FULL_45_17b]
MEIATVSPTTFVIFGVTGDLSKQRLIPALVDLYAKDLLPKEFRLVGFSRGAYTAEEFRKFLYETIVAKGHKHSSDRITRFIEHAHYCQGTFEEKDAYIRIAEKLASLDEKEIKQCSNKLFYLAVPPIYYGAIFDHLASSGLTIPCGGVDGWTRVLVEKPFGKDLETAQELEKRLSTLFQEEQIFRIDHYLAKETAQNILAFRFSNILFEPLWSNKCIEKVEINLHEQFGIQGRGVFYDGVGALRDVGQNHILQMLALVAMEDPKELNAALIRRERSRVLASLKLSQSATQDSFRRGQYAGYRDEEHVAKDSETETYFRIIAEVDNERWRGVPWVLEAGKKMPETKAEIQVYFKKTETCLCPPGAEHHHQNVLTFRIQPNEGISITFWAKKPGFSTELEPQVLSFNYKDSLLEQQLPDAYERVLYDCIRGDQTLFASTEEVEAAWRFVMTIMEQWKNEPLMEYDRNI